MKNRNQRLTTSDLAQCIGVKPPTLLSALSRNGNYFGIKPDRLPNGRLLWPHDSVETLIKSTAERSKR